MAQISNKVLEESITIIEIALQDKREEMDLAFLKADDKLKIGLSLSFAPAKDGGIDQELEINFVKDRVKDKYKGHTVGEGQGEMFDGDGKSLVASTKKEEYDYFYVARSGPWGPPELGYPVWRRKKERKKIVYHMRFGSGALCCARDQISGNPFALAVNDWDDTNCPHCLAERFRI